MRHCVWVLALSIAPGLPLPAAADEASTARRFEAAKRDEPSLIAFLRGMPKGGDLHHHVGGALYPEDGLQEAIRHELHFDTRTLLFQPKPGEHTVPARTLLTNEPLRTAFFDITTIRGAPATPAGGHDHFFRAFPYLSSPWQATPNDEAIATIVRRARGENVQYLELMENVPAPIQPALRAAAARPATDAERLAALRPLLATYVEQARTTLEQWDTGIAKHSGMTGRSSAPESPVTVRFLTYGHRNRADSQLFATWAEAFALMQADRRVVGVNLVAPEDYPIAQGNFNRHMEILDFLWKAFAQPNVSLHAGELNLFVSPAPEMSSHIRDSIVRGHARRIGHGTAIAWERDSPGLLRKMRDEGIAVEVCPTSAAVILGQKGSTHPFALYRRAGVPLTLNTDDEAVLRTNLTLEFVRAAQAWNLSYRDLKELARNSLEYSFLSGESLFENRNYRRLRSRYRGLASRRWLPSPEDLDHLANSERARVQARLERALWEFER